MSLLETLRQEIRNLPVSTPRFEIVMTNGGWQGKCLVLEPLNPLREFDKAREFWKTDPIKALAMYTARESIDTSTRQYYIDVDHAMNNVVTEVKNKIISFMMHHMGRDHEAVKWWDYYGLREQQLLRGYYMEPILSLYKYLHMNTDGNTIEEKHKQNVIGILEFIYQRDSRPEHMPPQRKRRARRRK